MDTLSFILVGTAAICGIAWAIDIPTTKWEGFRAAPRRKRTLLEILRQDQDATTEITHETDIQARTYTEAVKRMQDREKARLESRASDGDPS